MYSKLAFFVVSAFTLGTLAAPYDEGASPAHTLDVSQCNTGEIKCCDTVQDSKSDLIQGLAGALGINLGALTGQVGVSCVPVGVIGAGGNNCASQPVCCTGNNFSGLLTVGCTPININL